MGKWRIYYDDDTSHGYLDGPITRRFGVICIVQEFNERRNIQQRRDYYVLTDSWVPCDTFGVLDHVMHRLNEVKEIVAGRSISAVEFERIYLKAKEQGI